jgi:hypothetical protein
MGLFDSTSGRVNEALQVYARGERLPLYTDCYCRLLTPELQELLQVIVHTDLAHDDGNGMTNAQIEALQPIDYRIEFGRIKKATKARFDDARYAGNDTQAEMLGNQLFMLSDLQTALGLY